MPYVEPAVRRNLDPHVAALTRVGVGASEIAYITTKLCLGTKPRSWIHFALLIGMLVCVALELYRRRIAPYEDTKIAQNGDVF